MTDTRAYVEEIVRYSLISVAAFLLFASLGFGFEHLSIKRIIVHPAEHGAPNLSRMFGIAQQNWRTCGLEILGMATACFLTLFTLCGNAFQFGMFLSACGLRSALAWTGLHAALELSSLIVTSGIALALFGRLFRLLWRRHPIDNSILKTTAIGFACTYLLVLVAAALEVYVSPLWPSSGWNSVTSLSKDNVLDVDGLGKSYPGFALSDVSFSIAPGEAVALVGRNGAGKSTLIKACLGLLRVDEGTIATFGRPASAQQVGRQFFGYVAADHPLYDGLTASQFLRFWSIFYPTWDWEYCSFLQRRLQIDTGRRIRDLSHGTRTKLALVANLAYRPALLMLDEPTTGLDAATRMELLSELRETLQHEKKCAILFSSHLSEDVGYLADRVLVIRDGKLNDLGAFSKLTEEWKLFTLNLPVLPGGFPVTRADYGIYPASSRRQIGIVVRRASVANVRTWAICNAIGMLEERTPEAHEVLSSIV